MPQPTYMPDRGALSRVIAFTNRKGGVGKTTLSANFAGLAAASGMDVLLIDLDDQGNIEDDLGFDENPDNDHGKSLAMGLMFGTPVTPLKDVRPHLDVWTGGDNLKNASAALAAEMGKNPVKAKLALAMLIEEVAGSYDMVVIDCPPDEGPMQKIALGAARWAIVPTRIDTSSIKGLVRLTDDLDQIIDVNPGLDLLGVALTFVGAESVRGGKVTKRAAERHARELIQRVLGGAAPIFDQTIRASETVSDQVRMYGLLAHELDAKGKAEEADGIRWWKFRTGELAGRELTSKSAVSVADDMQKLAQEIITRIMDAEGAAAPEAQEVQA